MTLKNLSKVKRNLMRGKLILKVDKAKKLSCRDIMDQLALYAGISLTRTARKQLCHALRGKINSDVHIADIGFLTDSSCSYEENDITKFNQILIESGIEIKFNPAPAMI